MLIVESIIKGRDPFDATSLPSSVLFSWSLASIDHGGCAISSTIGLNHASFFTPDLCNHLLLQKSWWSISSIIRLDHVFWLSDPHYDQLAWSGVHVNFTAVKRLAHSSDHRRSWTVHLQPSLQSAHSFVIIVAIKTDHSCKHHRNKLSRCSNAMVIRIGQNSRFLHCLGMACWS